MFHKGIPYDSLLKMDIETLNSLLERIKEQTTNQSRLTEAQKELKEMAKKEREEWVKQK
jgi:hypothetical protein